MKKMTMVVAVEEMVSETWKTIRRNWRKKRRDQSINPNLYGAIFR